MYGKLIGNAQKTPQSEAARPDQVPNNAGGYAFQIDKWEQFKRFLILGTEAGTYYVSAPDLTKLNLDCVRACLAEDGPRVVRETVEVSQAGRAIKNDPAIVVLAAAISYGNAETKRLVRANIQQVCRTGTHILHFALYADRLRRWGRSLRSAVAGWYTDQCSRDVNGLAYQMVKYQSRDGWSHGDLIRKAHPGSSDPACAALFDWALHGVKPEKSYPNAVKFFEEAKTASPDSLVSLIADHGLSREMIPTDKLNDPKVAYALALRTPMTALIRNLANMTRASLLTPGHEVFYRVTKDLRSIDALKKARIHPISLLIAARTYASGQGVRGQHAWTPVPQVIDALNDAFYLSFQAVEPTDKNLLLAVDISGSMSSEVTSTPGFSAREAAAAMAVITANTESAYTPLLFDTLPHTWTLSPKQRLDNVLAGIPAGGGTDCAAPIDWALANQRAFDAILIYTDSETWAGSHHHPFQAMAEYRQRVNPKAKLIIVAATANHVTLAPADDPLSLTIVGFDGSVPEVIRAFLIG